MDDNIKHRRANIASSKVDSNVIPVSSEEVQDTVSKEFDKLWHVACPEYFGYGCPIFVFGQTVSFYVLTKNLQTIINKAFEFTEFQHCIIFNARTWQLEYRALKIMHRRSIKNFVDYIKCTDV